MLKKIFRLFTFVWSHPLNKNNRLGSLWRVVGWQILSRFSNGPVKLPYVNSTYLMANRGMIGATGDWYCGLREYEDMGFLLHFLKATPFSCKHYPVLLKNQHSYFLAEVFRIQEKNFYQFFLYQIRSV